MMSQKRLWVRATSALAVANGPVDLVSLTCGGPWQLSFEQPITSPQGDLLLCRERIDQLERLVDLQETFDSVDLFFRQVSRMSIGTSVNK